MDTEAVIGALGDSVAHAHAKDVVFDQRTLATSGLLDHRWPHGTELPWQFATVGDGHDAEWWSEFVAWPARPRSWQSRSSTRTHGSRPRPGVVAAAGILGEALSRAY